MKRVLKNLLAAGLLIASIGLAGCASTKELKATVNGRNIEKYDDAMLWKITDANKNSTVYCLGTYHLADSRAFPFADSVLSALDEADRFVAELSTEDFIAVSNEIGEKTSQSLLEQKGIKGNLSEYLSDEENALLLTILGEENYVLYSLFEPWVLNTILSGLIYTESGLSAEYGYDAVILSALAQNGIYAEGLDDMETQINIIAYGDFDTQLSMLKQTLEGLNSSEELVDALKKQYETYISHDAAAMEEVYFGDMKKEVKKYPYLKEYYKVLFDDRNEKWAYKINEYLNEEDTVTFIFAGTGHFIGEKSVFRYMKKQGSL